MLYQSFRNTPRLFAFSTYTPPKYEGVSYEQALNYQSSYMMPFYKPYYKEPFYAVRGQGQYLYDDKGDQYLDLCGGISCANVGHSHPRLVKIFKDQADKLLHISPIYLHEYHGEYAKSLCAELGEGFDAVYLCNSGSQANDFAHTLARLYTGSSNVFSLRKSYHGIAGNALSLSSIQSWNSSMPKMSETQKLAFPYLWKKPHLTVDHLIEDADQQMSASSNGSIAGFWAEPIMGAGGVYPLPDGYMRKMQALTKKYNGLFIADEVQTGFGRIGKNFWGFKMHGVEKPDIVVTAKAMANGYPMGAVVTSRKIMSSWSHLFFNTYGAGPLQCRLGMEVLNILKEEKLPENAENIGNYFLKEFKRIQQQSNKIGDVRGSGVMIAIEFVEDKESNKPNNKIAASLMEDFKKERILIAKSGEGNILRALSPLCITMEDAKKVVNVLESSIKKYD